MPITFLLFTDLKLYFIELLHVQCSIFSEIRNQILKIILYQPIHLKFVCLDNNIEHQETPGQSNLNMQERMMILNLKQISNEQRKQVKVLSQSVQLALELTRTIIVIAQESTNLPVDA